MFVLCELRKRAETVDTLLLYTSNSREILEAKKEEIYTQLWEKDLKWAKENDYTNLEALNDYTRARMCNYHIIEVPHLES